MSHRLASKALAHRNTWQDSGWRDWQRRVYSACRAQRWFTKRNAVSPTLLLFAALLLAGVRGSDAVAAPQDPPPAASAGHVRVTIRLKLDPRVYERTVYKHPPQFAIWLEDPAQGTVRTLYVTEKMGKGTWKGKPVCPVALPYWVTRYNKQHATKGPPTREQPVVDAITQPTPTNEFTTSCILPEGAERLYFVEVNVSGDFNDTFTKSSGEDRKDQFGNGQPSLVYRIRFQARGGARDHLRLVARTGQYDSSGKLLEDLAGITTARKLLSAVDIRAESVDQ